MWRSGGSFFELIEGSNPVINFLYGMGVSYISLYQSVKLGMTLISYDSSYIFSQIIITFSSIFGVGVDLPAFSYSHFASSTANPQLYEQGYGLGGSYLAEAYLALGLCGCFLIPCLISIILNSCEKHTENNQSIYFIYYSCLPLCYLYQGKRYFTFSICNKSLVVIFIIILYLQLRSRVKSYDRKNVSVIIPSYNRAHLLWEILPSYFQHEVLEVIVINDCSSDNTSDILREIKDKYPELIILENDKNRKQMFSKNKGLDVAKGKYVFFGDDDSYLLPDTIKQMLVTKKNTAADIVGARILYMNKDEQEFCQCIERHTREGKFISNLKNLEFCYTAALSDPVECFYAQALILVEKDAVADTRFDLRYTGNCYREETDFMLSLYLNGKKFVYDSQALLINLPPQKATGGARTANKFRYHFESVVNNYRFLKKFNKEINKVTCSNYSILHRQVSFYLF